MNTIHLEYNGQNARLALRMLPTPPEPPKPVLGTTAGPIERTRVVTGLQTLDPKTISAEALITSDPEINIADAGAILDNEQLTGIYVMPGTRTLVNDFDILEVTTDANGITAGPKPVNRVANIDTSIPVKVTKTFPLAQILTRFVFKNTCQIVHSDGLSRKFLFDLAKKLESENLAALLGAGSKGNQPITLRDRSTPIRAFLFGRTEGEKYKLLLIVTDTELRNPGLKAEPAPNHNQG